MKLGLYTFASLTLLIIIAVLTFVINGSYYTVNFLGLSLSLPVAIWFILPMALLLVLSLLHMAYYSTKNFFLLRKWQKDALTLDDSIYWSILNEPKDNKFGIHSMQEGASLLGSSSISLSESSKSKNPKIAEAISIANDIKSGKYIDFKANKLNKQLSNDNPMVVQNLLNNIVLDSNFSQTLLASKDNINSNVKTAALNDIASKETFKSAKKFIHMMSVAQINIMLNRVVRGANIDLDEETIKTLAEGKALSCSDYVLLAAASIKSINPRNSLSIFKAFQQKDEKAETAYLYLLLEYEMMTDVANFFEANPENEFKKLKIFYELKKTKNNYKLEDIFTLDTLCDEA